MSYPSLPDHWHSLKFISVHQASSSFINFHWYSLRFIGLHSHSPVFIDLHFPSFAAISIHPDSSVSSIERSFAPYKDMRCFQAATQVLKPILHP
jgi:hypothetical protein